MCSCQSCPAQAGDQAYYRSILQLRWYQLSGPLGASSTLEVAITPTTRPSNAAAALSHLGYLAGSWYGCCLQDTIGDGARRQGQTER
jgi:hypothetical protein